MSSLASDLAALLTTWAFTIPVLALIGLLIAWIAFARSEEPPEFAPRPVTRERSDDPVSVVFRSLGQDDFRACVRALRSSREEGSAEANAGPSFLGDRAATFDRLERLADRLARPPHRLGAARRERRRREFGRLLAEVSS